MRSDLLSLEFDDMSPDPAPRQNEACPDCGEPDCIGDCEWDDDEFVGEAWDDDLFDDEEDDL